MSKSIAVWWGIGNRRLNASLQAYVSVSIASELTDDLAAVESREAKTVRVQFPGLVPDPEGIPSMLVSVEEAVIVRDLIAEAITFAGRINDAPAEEVQPS